MKEIKVVNLIKKIGMGILVCFVFYYWYSETMKDQRPASLKNKEICIEHKNRVYSGVILNNYTSRGTLISLLNNKDKFGWYCKSKVRDIIEVGDSIYKPSGTFDTYIFKQANPDSVIFIECDFDCDYWIKRYGTK